jgi:pseudo-rSAM protein
MLLLNKNKRKMESINCRFSILSHVYYVQKNDKALLYNTQTGEHIHTQNTNIIRLLEQMHERQNLGVICITQKTFKQPDIDAFIKESVSKNICAITEKVEGQPKPIQLMPVLNLQRDIERLKVERERLLGENTLLYLSDVTIYLNNTCKRNCNLCEKYGRQIFHCHKSKKPENIDLEFLKQFIKQLTVTQIRRLAITGGNIFLYPQFSELLDYFKEEEIFPLFGIHYGNLDMNKITLLKDCTIELFVTFPLEENSIENIIAISKQDNAKIIFEVTGENDCNRAEQLISEHSIKKYSFRPVYTCENKDFFEKNVYLTKEDIFSEPVIQRIIFAHQKLNTNFFGRLHLFPNGDAKAHPSKETIGNCIQEPLVKVIANELEKNTAWRIVRDKEPCSGCLYQFICPSPSDYEFVTEKNNLCSVY